jgi:hypothetical protein
MFKLLLHFAFYTAFLGLTACSTVTTTTDFDPSAPFNKYRTYTLMQPNEEPPLSPSSEIAYRDALQSNLAARGLREVADNADLHVLRHVSTEEKLFTYQTTNFGYGYGYGYGPYGAWGGYPGGYTNVSEYTEGTLIIDFVDAKTRKLVFRGIGKGTMGDPQTNAQHIREAIQKIMLAFPNSSVK